MSPATSDFYAICRMIFCAFAPEMSTDRTRSDCSQFWPDQDCIGLQFFCKLAHQDWTALRKFLLFNVTILKLSKILVVVRFHRFAKC